jgi:hypothetical protein
MEELIHETELKGAELMTEIRKLMPDATIDAVLDTARLAQLHQQARLFMGYEFETALDLIDHMSTLSLTDEDLDTLSRILEENRGTLISEKCSHELAVLLNNGMFRTVFNLFLKLRKPQEPTGCFTWAARLGRRPHLPWCWSRTSPDTGKPDTGP